MFQYLVDCRFFFTNTATSDFSTLSLHDALPISSARREPAGGACGRRRTRDRGRRRSEEHTSELQSRGHLVCRLLLEKKNQPRFRRHKFHYINYYNPRSHVTSSVLLHSRMQCPPS